MSQSQENETLPNTPTPLFVEEMHWGEQPVRLTGFMCSALPADAPTTSVHVIAFSGGKVLVVRDRRGIFGFPGGRLEHGETYEDALAREVHEEARAHLRDGYRLFAALKVEYMAQIPGRNNPHPYSYMAVYAGIVRALEPIGHDPAGIITGRDLFSKPICEQRLPAHDLILLREATIHLIKFRILSVQAVGDFWSLTSTARS